MAVFGSIIEHIRREDVALFVGAGCSVDSGAPNGKALANMLFKQLPEDYRPGINEDDLQAVSEVFSLQDDGRVKLKSILVNTFSGLQPNIFHKGLLQIPHIRTIITTNYDTLIEEAYRCDYFQCIVSDLDCANLKQNAIHLFKVHGDIHHIDKVIISKSDYRHILEEPLNTILWNSVTSEIATKHVVFLGYSLEDDNVLCEIEHILTRLGDHRKKSFFIAPNISKPKLQQLKQLGVEFVPGTAGCFIQETLSYLKDKFGDDQFNNNCSQDTLVRFGLLNGIIFSLKNDGIHTKIDSLQGLSSPVTHNVHFDLTDDKLLRQEFSMTSSDLLKGFEMPVYCLSDDEKKTFKHYVNGLNIAVPGEKFKVLIAPCIDTVDVRFKSIKAGINKKIKAKKYSLNDALHICIDTQLCTIEYIFGPLKDFSTSLTGKVHVNLKEKFQNLEEALSWARLLNSMVINDDIKISINDIDFGSGALYHVDNPVLFQDVLDYCENLKVIEALSDVSFSEYEQYSPDRLFISRIVRSYITKEAFLDTPRKELRNLSIDLQKGGEYNEDAIYIARIMTNITGPILLCGHEFNVPQERVLLTKCRFERLETSNQEHDTVKITILTDKIQYSYHNFDDPDLTDGQISE